MTILKSFLISPILKDNLPDIIIMAGRFLLSGLEIHSSIFFLLAFIISCFTAARANVTVIFLNSLPIVFHLIYCASNPRHLLVFQHLNYFSSNVHC